MLNQPPFPSFPPRMFFNGVTFHKKVDPPRLSDEGGEIPEWPEVGEAMPGRVQPSTADRVEADGTIVAVTTHLVLTPNDVGAVEGDQFRWKGKRLSAQGPTEDGGFGTLFHTSCQEVN